MLAKHLTTFLNSAAGPNAADSDANPESVFTPVRVFSYSLGTLAAARSHATFVSVRKLKWLVEIVLGVVRTRGRGELVLIDSLPIRLRGGRTRVRVKVRGFGLLRIGNHSQWIHGHLDEIFLIPKEPFETVVRFRSARTRLERRIRLTAGVGLAAPASYERAARMALIRARAKQNRLRQAPTPPSVRLPAGFLRIESEALAWRTRPGAVGGAPSAPVMRPRSDKLRTPRDYLGRVQALQSRYPAAERVSVVATIVSDSD